MLNFKSQFVEMFESKDYNKATIGKCAKFQGGYAFKSKDFVENGVKLVQISNVNKDTLDWIEINRVPESFIEKYNIKFFDFYSFFINFYLLVIAKFPLFYNRVYQFSNQAHTLIFVMLLLFLVCFLVCPNSLLLQLLL